MRVGGGGGAEDGKSAETGGPFGESFAIGGGAGGLKGVEARGGAIAPVAATAAAGAATAEDSAAPGTEAATSIKEGDDLDEGGVVVRVTPGLIFCSASTSSFVMGDTSTGLSLRLSITSATSHDEDVFISMSSPFAGSANGLLSVSTSGEESTSSATRCEAW